MINSFDYIECPIEKLKYINDNSKISIEVSEDVSLLFCDFNLMEQALINIIHNSMEYTPENSTIKIEAKNI